MLCDPAKKLRVSVVPHNTYRRSGSRRNFRASLALTRTTTTIENAFASEDAGPATSSWVHDFVVKGPGERHKLRDVPLMRLVWIGVKRKTPSCAMKAEALSNHVIETLIAPPLRANRPRRTLETQGESQQVLQVSKAFSLRSWSSHARETRAGVVLTSATVVPGSTTRSNLSKTTSSGREGYANRTPLSRDPGHGQRC